METVLFDYYSNNPRLRVSFKMRLQTIPIIGDYIFVESKFITEVSTKITDSEKWLIKNLGKEFIVVKRTKHTISPLNEDWRIELKLTKPLRLKKL